MDFRLVARLSIAPLIIGLVGAMAAFILAGFASAKGFAAGALLIAIATLVSSGFYARARSLNAGRVLIRLAVTSALKWIVVMGGAACALIQGGLPPAAFTCGVIAGLVSTLFNLRMTSTDASTS
ncbi:MAG: hypothetical protein V4650_13100 [Pseudomonadota bacterium]